MIGEIESKEIRDAITKLKTDPVRNSSIIGFIKNNPISSISTIGTSTLIKGRSDKEWIHISSKNEVEFRKILKELKAEDAWFASLEDWMIKELTKTRKVEWQLTTSRYFLPGKTVIPDNKIKLAQLNSEDAPYILNNSYYKHFLTVDYLKDRIERSFSASVRENGKLVAWALTHDDGAIGALHVLEEFRGKGYAREIVCNLSCQIRNAGDIPIAQIEEKNVGAIRLFEKLGFIKDRNTTWLKLFEQQE